jgi:hypothetical protein
MCFSTCPCHIVVRELWTGLPLACWPCKLASEETGVLVDDLLIVATWSDRPLSRSWECGTCKMPLGAAQAAIRFTVNLKPYTQCRLRRRSEEIEALVRVHVPRRVCPGRRFLNRLKRTRRAVEWL